MTTDAVKRWRAATLAVLAAASFGLASSCTDEAPAQSPDTEQDDGNGGQDDDNDEQDDDGY